MLVLVSIQGLKWTLGKSWKFDPKSSSNLDQFSWQKLYFSGDPAQNDFLSPDGCSGAPKNDRIHFLLVPCCCFLPKMGSKSIALCALWVEARARSRQDRSHTCLGIHFLSILDNFGCQNLIIWMYFLSNAAVKFSLFWFWSSVRKRVRVQRFHFIQTFPAFVVHTLGGARRTLSGGSPSYLFWGPFSIDVG